jgi:Fic family protein
MYNWQKTDWLNFKYTLKSVEATLLSFAQETSYISGVFEAMPDKEQTEATINMMASEAMKSSAIEGEYLQRSDVMSSIRNNLGLSQARETVHDKKSGGAGELMVAVRKTFSEPLTEDTLFAWHKMLMGYTTRIKTGQWRTHEDAMQVISGAMGKEVVHFEAPPSSRVAAEMKKFIQWFNDTAPGAKKEIKEAPVRSAIAHLYFESIHPFEDGNGRIGRAVAEKALSQTLGRPVVLSLSQVIEAKKKTYYEELEKAQRSNTITEWISYFVNTVLEAQLQAKKIIEVTLKKAKLFDRFKDRLNSRQLKALRKMFDAEPGGFEGGMTAAKYVSINKTSRATATRDLQELSEMGVLISQGGGRSIHYTINIIL